MHQGGLPGSGGDPECLSSGDGRPAFPVVRLGTEADPRREPPLPLVVSKSKRPVYFLAVKPVDP